MLTTPNLGLSKPQPTDAPSALRTAIGGNADTLDADLKPISAIISRSTNQAIPSLTTAAVQFTTEESDTDGLATLGTSNDRLTIQHGGVYIITAYCEAATTITFALEAGGVQVGAGGGTVPAVLSAVVVLAPGAIIQLRAANSAGSAANVTKARLATARISI